MMYQLSYDQNPTTVVRFLLVGDTLQPAQVTAALRINPSKSWIKGDPRVMPSGRTLGKYQTNGWQLVPNALPDQPFEIQLGKLITLLESLPPVLNALVQEFNGGIRVGYSSGLRNFGFLLERDVIQRLANLGLSISFDLYSIQGGGNDDT